MSYRKQFDSLVWQFFVVCDDPSKAKCKCGKVYKSALHFWKTQCQIFPQLAELALQYLSAPISSVASEREFKVVRDLANGNRTRLKSANVQKLLFLKHNVKAIGYITLPCWFKIPKSKSLLPMLLLKTNLYRKMTIHVTSFELFCVLCCFITRVLALLLFYHACFYVMR